MNRATWKARELWWAEQLGGRRVPVTGRSRGSAPDVEHETWAIEVKHGRVMSPRIREGMVQAMAAAAGTDKTPLLCVTHTTGSGHRAEHYIVMRLCDWQAWMVPEVPSE